MQCECECALRPDSYRVRFTSLSVKVLRDKTVLGFLPSLLLGTFTLSLSKGTLKTVLL